MKSFFFRSVALAAATLATLTAQAQFSREYLYEHPVLLGAHYTPYPDTVQRFGAAPKGYKPVYMSHYSRHGSRYLVSDGTYMLALNGLTKAAEAGALTEEGQSLLDRVARMAKGAEGRWGSLSARGAREHRAIAERMYRNLPELFRGEARIVCSATQSPRSILSMAANNERLKELNPKLQISRRADIGEEHPLLRHTPHLEELEKDFGPHKKFFRPADLDYSRFASVYFKGDIKQFTSEKSFRNLMYYIYSLSSIVHCTDDEGVSFDEVFTPEELYEFWKGQNYRHYLICGNSPEYGDGIVGDARPLLAEIIRCADAALAGNGVAADLRFGHDIALAPLVALLKMNNFGARCGMEELPDEWSDFDVMPMAANLQIIFYRHKKSGDVLVKLLHNEREAHLPIAGEGAFYHWNDLRAYMVEVLGSDPAVND